MSRYLDVFRSFKPNRTECGLDLAYIPLRRGPRPEHRVIAMCEPARSRWHVLRNNPKELGQFIEARHGSHFVVYNLTEYPHPEETKRIFGDRVVHIPIPDHNPPRFQEILEFCMHASHFLKQDERNCIAVHCKAGKGRTGTMICCFLLYCGGFDDPEAAMDWFARHRSQPTVKIVRDPADGSKRSVTTYRGVDQASQVTWVRLFHELLRSPQFSQRWVAGLGQTVRRTLRYVLVHDLPEEYSVEVAAHIRAWGTPSPESPEGGQVLRAVHKHTQQAVAQFPRPVRIFRMGNLELAGENKLEIRSGDNSLVCRLWFHPYFVPHHGILRTPKSRVDDAWCSPKFDEEFTIELQFGPVDPQEWDQMQKVLVGDADDANDEAKGEKFHQQEEKQLREDQPKVLANLAGDPADPPPVSVIAPAVDSSSSDGREQQDLPSAAVGQPVGCALSQPVSAAAGSQP